MTWAIISGVVGTLFVILAIVVTWRHMRAQRSAIEHEPNTIDSEAYFAVTPLTNAERAFHKFLKTCLPHHVVYVHVTAGKLVKTKWWVSDFHHRRIADLSIDFLVCRPDCSVVAAIGLSDGSCDTPEHWRRTARMEALMLAVNVPWLHWDIRRPPSSLEVRKIIADIS